MTGYLVLENGRVFKGKLLNDCIMAGGEVVFTTAMISYQDIITDPSFYGQIVVMTYPLVGNVGLNEKSFASRLAMVSGLVLREATDFPSHYEMETDLISFLNKCEVAVLTEVDTRALTREIRSAKGALGGIITDTLEDLEALKMRAARIRASIKNSNPVQYVTRKNIMTFGRGDKTIVMVDFGCKRGVLDSFEYRGVRVIAVPATTSASEILNLKPDGVFLSDGPGSPEDITWAVETVTALLGKVPVFGIGLGHQLLGLTLGGNIIRLPHGHRGGNQPVRDLKTGRIYITTQNHGYALDRESLNPAIVTVTHDSLNDGSVEGIRHVSLPAFSVQFDPEGYPGYSDTGFFYDQFISMFNK